jgi:hypothetical protein
VVSIIGCTGDWTGGWDCSTPVGVDRFISADLKEGRMVEVIDRGEPAIMVAHWTGIYWNGEELGFKVFQEVVRRLNTRYDHLLWMKLSEVARYWAAKELTRIEQHGSTIILDAPFGCPDFTLSFPASGKSSPHVMATGKPLLLKEVAKLGQLESGRWFRQGETITLCYPLPRGASSIEMRS